MIFELFDVIHFVQNESAEDFEMIHNDLEKSIIILLGRLPRDYFFGNTIFAKDVKFKLDIWLEKEENQNQN